MAQCNYYSRSYRLHPSPAPLLLKSVRFSPECSQTSIFMGFKREGGAGVPVLGPVYITKMSQKFYKWHRSNAVARIPFLVSTLWWPGKASEDQRPGRRPPAERMNVRVVLFFLARRRCWWLDCGQAAGGGPPC